LHLRHSASFCFMASAWRKVLYLRQAYDDNYVDDSFLDSLILNAHVTGYEFRVLSAKTISIIRQLCLVAIFVTVWWKVQLALDVGWLLAIGGSFCGFLVCQTGGAYKGATEVWQEMLKASTIVFPLGVLSPLLQALTSSWSDDTIGVIACGLLLLHVVVYDYSDSSFAGPGSSGAALFLPGGPVALNASILSAMILASRLQTSLEVFAFMSFAMEVFALPHFRGPRAPVYVLILFAFALVVVALDSRPMAVALALASILVCSLGPALFLWAQQYKAEIQGPWDIAHIVS